MPMQIIGSGTRMDDTTIVRVTTDGRMLVSAEISGNIHIGSVSANVDSIYIQSGDSLNLGTAWTGVGSVVISGTVPTTVAGIGSVQLVPGSLEVYQATAADLNITVASLSDAGSIGIQGVSGDRLGISGIVNQGGTWNVGITTDPVPVSGIVNQGTTPWSVSGTSTISAGADSIFGVSGTVVGVSGIINQGTSPWAISGVVNVGSIVGSIAITNFAAIGSNITGSVTINSLTPGTGETQLGKAIGSSIDPNAVGVLALGVHVEEAVKIEPADDTTAHMHIGELGGLWVEPEQHNHFDEMDATTDWTVLGNDTINFLATTNHLTGTNALTFDKTDGLANTIFAGIQKTITTTDLGAVDLHDTIQTVCYIPDTTLVAYVFIRIGTDSSNYNEWRILDDDLVAGEFQILGPAVGGASHTGKAGNGWNPTAISYIAVGVAFDDEANALTGIIFDQLGFFTTAHSTSTISSEVSSSVSSPNVTIKKWGAKNVTNATVLADNISDPTAALVGAHGMWYDGANWDRARGDSTDGLLVNLGTNNDLTVGSVSIHGIGSVQLVPGSLEVYQTTNSDLQVQATQETNPWIVLGSTRMIPGDRVPGSIVNLPNVVQADSVRQISAGSVIVTGVKGGSLEVFQTTSSDMVVNIATNPVPVLGSTRITSVAAGSIESYQASASELNVTVANLSDAGSIETQGVSGTVFNQVWLGTGSVVISGTSIPPSRGVGSVVISGTSIPVSRGVGSVVLVPGSLEVYQTTAADMVVNLGTVYTGVGSVVMSGTSVPVSRGVGSVLALFTDSSNNLDSPLVADGSYLMFAGSISSIPSITATNESVAKPGTAGLGSMTLIAGFSGGVAMPLRTTNGSDLAVSVTTVLPGVGSFVISGTSIPVSRGVGSVVISGTSIPVSRGVGSVVISGTSIPVSRGVGSVLTLFTDSANTLDSPLVADGSYLMMAGSISSMPSITVDPNPSVYKMSGANILPGSVTLVGAWFAGSSYPLHLETGSSLLTIGSTHIVNFGEVGSIETQGVSGTIFNTVWIGTGSTVISGTSVPVSRGVGSVLGLFTDSSNNLDSPLVADGSYLMMAGSISSMPSITATNESVAKPGTEGLGSMTIIAGFSGGVAMPLRTTAGSDLAVSVTTVLPGVGSFVISGTSIPPMRGVGSVVISGTSIPVFRGIGSVVLVPGSLEAYQAAHDELNVNANIQIGNTDVGDANPVQVSGTAFNVVWIGVGSTVISGTSIPVSRGIGSVVLVPGSLEVYQTTAADMVVNLGTVYTGVGSVVISGTSVPVSRGIGSVRISNAEPIRTQPDRGVFFSSGATVHTSGTATVIHTPGTGSNVLLKGFTASAELSTHFRLIFSGGTPTHIMEFDLPNSGTVAMNLLGMEPSGAVNQPISVGLFNAGSIHITVFGQDTL